MAVDSDMSPEKPQRLRSAPLRPAEPAAAVAIPRSDDVLGIPIAVIDYERALDWNNAYSLWCARKYFRTGAVIVNGDTVHSADVERLLLAGRGKQVSIAVDRSQPVRRCNPHHQEQGHQRPQRHMFASVEIAGNGAT